jgi:hypothetical protein
VSSCNRGKGEFLQCDGGVCFCNRRKGCDSAIRGCVKLVLD